VITSDFVDELAAAVGRDNVLTDPGALFVYSYDGALDKNLPGAVVLPRTAGDVAAAVKLAHAAKIPYVARGAGTNLCGGSVAAAGGLVIHMARLNRVGRIDVEKRLGEVEPGVVNLHFQKALAPHGLFYAPDPASQKACTLGGNVGTNAGGPHCLKYGVTTNHVEGLEVVLPGGEIVRTRADHAGLDLTGLFVGSEGTLGIVTKIWARLLPLPEDVRTLLVSFPSLETAVQSVTDIISAGIVPTTLEIMDRTTILAVEAFIHAGYPTDAEAVLLIEVDGARDDNARDVQRIDEICRKNACAGVRVAQNEAERQKLWEGRRGSYPAMARLAPNVLVEDGVVPRHLLPEAVKRIRAIAARESLRMGLIAHAGDGNLHPNIVFDERDEAETRRVKAAGYEMLKVCVDLGGSISGEHGIGTDKRDAMRWLFTPSTLAAFRRLKKAFDPANLCNPDKLIPAAAGPDDVHRPVDPLPAGAFRATTVDDVRKILRSAFVHRQRLSIKGLGTKGLPVSPEARVLLVAGLKKVVEHDRANFTLTIQAGATLEEIRAVLAPAGQYLHLGGDGTLGGVLSSRYCLEPRLRDQVIGMKVVLADGSVADFGGKVMKNVAGYDAAKLFIGAWGALGVIAQVTLRTHPTPCIAPRLAFPLTPFRPTPLDRRIKDALDPGNLLNPGLFEKDNG